MVSRDKRREDRVEPKGVSLWLRYADGAMICGVLNVSRTGIALKIDGDALPDSLPAIHAGSVLKATLKIEDASYAVSVRVQRIAGTELGCSLVFADDETQMRVAEALSPRFVARSIVKVNPGFLGQELRYAFFGADFWFLAYQAPQDYRIVTSDISCRVNDGGIAVERVSEPAFGNDQAVGWQPSRLPNRSESPLSAKEKLGWIVAVLDAWDDKPQDVVVVADRIRSHHPV